MSSAMLKKGAVWILVLVGFVGKEVLYSANALPHRVLLDTDMGTDDLLALLYLLKLNKSEIDLQAITINSNTWSHAGHAVNHLYDILYMMGRDDIMVGVGGEGGIFPNGTILPDVGGYLPVIEQGISTVGGCRYRQSIPMGSGGLLDVDTNYGLRRGFLPQGNRKYSPLRQPSVQKVMIDTISKGPTTLFVIGAHTNFALFLMKNHHLKKNVEHIYVMGGGARGNLFTGYTSNPYAEFNIFGDPFAAYQIFHSGIPITLVPLDATDTIPITEEFVKLFETRQDTYEAKYCYLSLKMAKSCCMWDSFMAGVASSIMRNLPNSNGENEFAEMHFMNITVITSNEPYGISDGSNPFFDGQATPRFNLQKVGVHSGHVQTGLRDPFCFVEKGKGKCKDGYTKEVSGPEGVRVLVATRAKPNQDPHSKLNREFFKSFLDVLNSPHQTGRFNFTTQFPQYEEIVYKPNIGKKKLGKPVVFDMDMSAGDFVALIYLLKVPVEIINLKGILVSATGWTNSATIDTVYDVLHMMGRDDIPVGRGEVFAMGQPNPSFTAVGDCKYVKAIPHGSGGQLDSDTLFGFARYLPRSPRRYTAEKYVKIETPTDTDLSELRQPLALEVWQSIAKSMQPGSKISLLTNGPLSNIAQVILSEKNVSSVIEKVYVVGGHINHSSKDRGNAFTLPLNRYAEFNIFLDPYAAKTVLESGLDITLIPLSIQRKVSSFPEMIESLRIKSKTPEGVFAHHLLSGLYNLQKSDHRYHHMDIFLGEILGAVILGGGDYLATSTQVKFVNVSATGNTSTDGQIFIDKKHGSSVKIVESVNTSAYYQHFSDLLGNDMQSAKIGSFSEQKRIYTPTHQISREAKLRSH